MKNAALALLICSLFGFAHERTLAISANQARPGEPIEVRGAGLGANLRVILSLEGAKDIYPLGESRGDAHGQFQITVVLPPQVKPGAYLLKARADGIVASAGLKVLPSAVADTDVGHRATGHAGTPAPEGAAAPPKHHEISAEPLSLDRSRTPAETAIIWAAIVLSAIGALGLWARR